MWFSFFRYQTSYSLTSKPWKIYIREYQMARFNCSLYETNQVQKIGNQSKELLDPVQKRMTFLHFFALSFLSSRKKNYTSEID